MHDDDALDRLITVGTQRKLALLAGDPVYPLVELEWQRAGPALSLPPVGFQLQSAYGHPRGGGECRRGRV